MEKISEREKRRFSFVMAARLLLTAAYVLLLSAFDFDRVGARIGTEFYFAVFRPAAAVEARIGLGRGLWSGRRKTAGGSASVLFDRVQKVPLVCEIASHKGASLLQIMSHVVFFVISLSNCLLFLEFYSKIITIQTEVNLWYLTK